MNRRARLGLASVMYASACLATMRPDDVLAGLDRLPLAVIQSTPDSYLPTTGARPLFVAGGPRDELGAVRRRT